MPQNFSIYGILGSNLRHIREKQKISQEELAALSGLNRAYIGYIEREERKPSLDTIEKIARVLDVEPYVLLLPKSKFPERF